MGRITEVWQLALANAASWFLAGVCIALLSVIAGLFAGKRSAGASSASYR